jgi:hypothetical protein
MFPLQVQQVFYFNDSFHTWWKSLIGKEPWSKCDFLDTYEEYISRNEYKKVLNAWGDMLDEPIVPNSLDSIFLSKKVEGQLSIEEGSQLEVILEDGLLYQCKGMWIYKQHFLVIAIAFKMTSIKMCILSYSPIVVWCKNYNPIRME